MARSRTSSGTPLTPASPESSSALGRAARLAPAFNGTFYPADVDGSPAAFVVDLAQEPRASHATRITVSVSMQDPEPDGLRSGREMEDLDVLQTKLTDRLATAAAAECVGFYDLRGVSTFVFYGKEKLTTAEATVAVADTHPYDADVLVDDDPEWRFYIDAMFPDAYAFQGIWNRSVLEEHESHGDQLDEPRDVDHVATFPSIGKAQKAAKVLEAARFDIDGIGHADEEGRFEVAFHRSETLEDGKPDQFTAEILDLVLALEGEYEGWGAPAVMTRQGKAASKKGAKPAKAKAAPKKAAPKKAAPKKAAPKKAAKSKKAAPKKAAPKKAAKSKR